MPPIRLGPHDLLEYDARYGVLICRECQYAIQKSALQSHLLRHKIYRDERQRLLSSIARLELFEPDDVPLPSPAFPPIEALPIISGFRCTAAGCGNLCASSKRMSRHRSEVHGFSETSNFSSFARPVTLQTFFRGTKIRYFEVAPSAATGPAGVESLAISNDDDEEDEDEKSDEEETDEPVFEAETATSRLSSRVPTISQTPPKSLPVDVNLETLTYFHHFTTTTSFTLPSAEHVQLVPHYWQTDVVLQALQRRWLMCGLLAISACHLAMLVDDTAIEQIHRERSAHFLAEFSTGWGKTTKLPFGSASASAEEEAKEAGRQINYIFRCANWALAGCTLDPNIITQPGTPSRLQFFMTTVRDLFISDFAILLGCIQSHDNGQGEAFVQATRILNTRSSSEAGGFGAFPSSDDAQSTLLNRLSALPPRMAEALGKPDNTIDVLVTMSAIAALVECCAISFASNDAGAAWRGMATWLTKVPDRFNDMVSQRSAAALMVLAHWAPLVERAEHCGCWFLRGSAKTILLHVAELLPADNRAVQSLVGDLIA